MMPVTVLVAVGPNPSNRRWLDECIMSVSNQTWNQPGKGGVHLQLVDDMADLSLHMIPSDLGYSIWKSPWYLGVAHAFNIGVAVAPTEHVFMLGSDDWLEPECIEACVQEYQEKNGDPYGYFYVGVRYSDTGETQEAACHAAMVSKSLWRRTGGFPIQSSSGAPDAALLSIIIGNYPRAGRHWLVANGRPLYNYRRHSETDTASKAPWQQVILATRNLVTSEWRPRQEDPNE